MPFIAQEEEVKNEIIDGKRVIKYRPQVEVTLKHVKTGREYMSDSEALEDIQSPHTETKAEDVSKSVHVKMIGLPLGTDTNII
jgi:hypothetical protein|tara:strand:+ start:154 stop:402 length:249 start_codon:yes stop_codon:yes gene_type:complete